MRLVVISPEGDEPREHTVMAELFAAGLERYHVRKPLWAKPVLRDYIAGLPEQWRSRLVLHQHHELAQELGCDGVHFKDSPPVPASRAGLVPRFTSRSCHTLTTLSAALGRFDSVFFSPVFPSISKAGYVPSVGLAGVASILARRDSQQRRTAVIALGGVTPGRVAQCAGLGFDGVAVLGALWQADEPLKMFQELRQSLTAHAA